MSKKKFVILPFKDTRSVTILEATEKWQTLSLAIAQIYSSNSSTLSFEELYRSAYNLVLHKHGEILYEGVRSSITSHLTNVTKSIILVLDDTSSNSGGQALLTAVCEAWSNHQITLVMVRDILMYMDRTYVQQATPRKKQVYSLGLEIFRDVVWDGLSPGAPTAATGRSRVKERIVKILLDCVERERTGGIVERGRVKVALEMLGDIDVYERDFQAPFLAATRDFFRGESQTFLESNPAPLYVQKAQARIAEEAARVTNYLSSTTASMLSGIVDEELIERHAEGLVEMGGSGVVAMLENDRVEDLKQMFTLFKRCPTTVEILWTAVSAHVHSTGRHLIAQQAQINSPITFVTGVLSMRDKYDSIVEKSFNGDKRAQKKLKEAFETFLNVDSRAASYLAVYLDQLMRSGLKGVQESEADEKLGKVIAVFRYLQDKDIFEDFYRKHLGRRLLQNKSLSDTYEKICVAKLKTECGYQFTSKLEGMFNDMRISKDTMSAYKLQNDAHPSFSDPATTPPTPLEVDVLTTGYWPTQNVPPCQLPPSIETSISEFEKFYLTKHGGRKLAWQTSEGTAEIKATFEGGRRHDLVVSTYQMCILMQFNSADTVSLSSIRTTTNIPEAELRRHLISLCTSKHKILKKSSKGKNIESNDSFSFNYEFKSNMKRVKVPLVSMKETTTFSAPGDGKDINLSKAIEEERRFSVEASIVRIMKSRRTLTHNELIAETNRQLTKFAPTPNFVKQRIESLIEREYLERDLDDPRVYAYLA